LKVTPDSEERGKLHSVAEEPAKGNHGGNPVSSVDSRVQIVVCDHHVSRKTQNLINSNCGVVCHSKQFFWGSRFKYMRAWNSAPTFDNRAHVLNKHKLNSAQVECGKK